MKRIVALEEAKAALELDRNSLKEQVDAQSLNPLQLMSDDSRDKFWTLVARV